MDVISTKINRLHLTQGTSLQENIFVCMLCISVLGPYPCRQNSFTFGTLCLACLGMVGMQITMYRMLISNTDGPKFQKQQL